jgi:hypothetical protein
VARADLFRRSNVAGHVPTSTSPGFRHAGLRLTRQSAFSSTPSCGFFSRGETTQAAFISCRSFADRVALETSRGP